MSPADLLSQSTERCKQFASDDFPVLLDTLPVERGSIHISPDLPFNLDPVSGLLELETDQADSVEVCYHVVNPLLFERYSHRDLSTYDYIGNFTRITNTPIVREEDELFKTPNLYKSGSITRGVTVGNRQNLFVNSALNLQLNGQLTDDLNIRAVITDQNIPFQPEGNTQQLRDFDNVNIKIYNDRFELNAGDIVLQKPEEYGYFLKYYKNQQGFQVRYNQPVGQWQSATTGSVALSKGKFASVKVQVIEGVQGPYKLRGPDAEQFIIVLANSEKVYLDGILLKRGFNEDYVIDYNLGELTFNPSVVLTRFSRIRVDFEFTQQSFPRSNMLISQTFTHEKARIYADFYREKDDQNNPLRNQFEFSDLQQFQTAGDAENVIISGVDSTSFSQDRILYDKVDTLADGQRFEVFLQSANPETAKYLVTFSQVGAGDYILSQNTSNGRVFQWMAPVNGVSQGNYAPVIRVVSPNSRQMLVLGTEVQVVKNLGIYQEIAYADQDQNLLSTLDDKNNGGLAWKGGLKIGDITPDFLPGYKLKSGLSFEYNSTDFRPIDRFRAIDFDRDWSYLFPYDSAAAAERLGQVRVSLEKNRHNLLRYNLDLRERVGVLRGHQQRLDLNQKYGRFFYSGRHFWMENNVLSNRSTWGRTKSEIGVDTGPLTTGYFFDLDRNVIRDGNGDIVSSAMYYDEHGVFVRSGDSLNMYFDITGAIRRDKLPSDGKLDEFTESRRLQITTSPFRTESHRVKLTTAYRFVRDFINTAGGQKNIQGQLNAANKFLSDQIRSNLMYGVSSNRELKREFIFTQVGVGQGTHTWRDENEDGFQDLNEFYEALNQDERNYIKLFIPTDEYISAFQTLFQHSLSIRFPTGWKDGGGLPGMISRFSFQSNVNITLKNTDDQYPGRINPFISFGDSSVISGKRAQRYVIFFNQSQPGVGFAISRILNDGKRLNQNGFELTSTRKWDGNVRWNLLRMYQINANVFYGSQDNTSDFLNSRNFMIREKGGTGSLTWLISNTIRIAFSYGLVRKQDELTEGSGDKSLKNEIGTNFTWARPRTGNISFDVKFLNIDYEGQQNTYLSYLLLEALRPGNNVKMNVNWQHNLRKGLQLTMQYFGRVSEGTGLINTGNIQLTAFF